MQAGAERDVVIRVAGQVEPIESCIRQTAEPWASGQACGGLAPDAVPNHGYGWGRAELVWPPPPFCTATDEIFVDGFESGNVTAWGAAVP